LLFNGGVPLLSGIAHCRPWKHFFTLGYYLYFSCWSWRESGPRGYRISHANLEATPFASTGACASAWREGWKIGESKTQLQGLPHLPCHAEEGREARGLARAAGSGPAGQWGGSMRILLQDHRDGPWQWLEVEPYTLSLNAPPPHPHTHTLTQQEDREGNAVIILQPGSSTLHLGLSTSYTPHSLPHLIAYRSTEGGGESGGAERAGVIPTDGSLVLRHEVEITVSID